MTLFYFTEQVLTWKLSGNPYKNNRPGSYTAIASRSIHIERKTKPKSDKHHTYILWRKSTKFSKQKNSMPEKQSKDMHHLHLQAERLNLNKHSQREIKMPRYKLFQTEKAQKSHQSYTSKSRER